MSTLALEVEQTLQQLNAETASRLERLVRDALALVKPAEPAGALPEPLKIFRQLQQEIALTPQTADEWQAAVGDARR